MNVNSIISSLKNRYGVSLTKNSNTQFTVAYKTPNGKRSYIIVEHDYDNGTSKLSNGYSDPSHRGRGVGTALRAVATWILHLAGYKNIKHQGINKEKLTGPNQYPISTVIVRKHIGFKRYRRNEPSVPSNTYARKGSPRGNVGYNSKWNPNKRSVMKLKRTVRKSTIKLKKHR